MTQSNKEPLLLEDGKGCNHSVNGNRNSNSTSKPGCWFTILLILLFIMYSITVVILFIRGINVSLVEYKDIPTCASQFKWWIISVLVLNAICILYIIAYFVCYTTQPLLIYVKYYSWVNMCVAWMAAPIGYIVVLYNSDQIIQLTFPALLCGQETLLFFLSYFLLCLLSFLLWYIYCLKHRIFDMKTEGWSQLGLILGRITSRKRSISVIIYIIRCRRDYFNHLVQQICDTIHELFTTHIINNLYHFIIIIIILIIKGIYVNDICLNQNIKNILFSSVFYRRKYL